VRAKQNSLHLQEAYFMFCDIFKMIETKYLVNSIQNLPFELLNKLEKLNRFVSEIFIN
jgi:Txe/YoeB family toxin of Txe-Axe toxin-antitoxin module